MKMIFIQIGLVLLVGLIVYLTSCKNKQKSEHSGIESSDDTVTVHKLPGNVFEDLRNIALGMTPEQLQINLPADQTKVFGVVMDWDLGEGIATFVSFETGDASMYLSSGGGMIGGSGHEEVKTAAKRFVTEAQTYLNRALKIDSMPLPDKGCVRFYLLTNKGRFTAQEQLVNFENKTSVWLPLFEEANKVITELRIVEEKMQGKN